MEIKEGRKKEGKLKHFWKWLWSSDSLWSYVVFLVIAYVVIKFIFFPLLGLAFGGVELPLAIVESSSMDHSFLKYCTSLDSSKNTCNEMSEDYSVCGKYSDESGSSGFDSYWETCKFWYENHGITKEQFEEFDFKNGFSKGDILIITNYREPKVGDVLLFKANQESLAPRPIIHRVVSTEPLQTKGDHNEKQLEAGNNVYKTDETNIEEERIMGIATARIPLLGWVKLIFVEIYNKLR